MKEFFKSLIRPVYYAYLKRKINKQAKKTNFKNAREIPIIINNRNRLTYMLQLIEALECRGYTNIYIIDNASTYEPLLKYYDICKYNVFRLKYNGGYLSLWVSGIIKQFQKDYFVYTDSDVVPIEECADDFLETFLQEMKRNDEVFKIGLGLKIDDLPDHFINKDKVVSWEKQFFEKRISELYFEALVDTTYALYKPYMPHGANSFLKSYRSAYPYASKHLPWYVNSNSITEEELYYINNAETSTHWTIISK